MNYMEVRATDFVEFADCRRKWYYKNIRGFRPGPSVSMDKGTAIHAGIAGFYKQRMDGETDGGEVFTERLIRAACPNLSDEDVEKCVDITRYFIERKASVEQRKILAVEEEHPLTIGPFTIHCHLDVVVEDVWGDPVVIDNKTKGSLPSDYRFFDLDWQMKLYQLAAYDRYEKVPAVEHHLIRREVPPGFGHRPEYNEGIYQSGPQAGKAWRRRSTASTDPDDYIKVYKFQKTKEVLQAYANDVSDMLSEMVMANAAKDRFAFIRKGNYTCNTCPFIETCIREAEGEVVNDDLLKQVYVIRKEEDDENV